MAPFGRQVSRRGPLPVHDLVGAMARFGRFEYDTQASGEDPGEIYQSIIAPLYPAASVDPAGFVVLLEG
ncbi:MAG: hypothetical protein ACRDNW_21575 [Trebonia sp.]